MRCSSIRIDPSTSRPREEERDAAVGVQLALEDVVIPVHRNAGKSDDPQGVLEDSNGNEQHAEDQRLPPAAQKHVPRQY